MIAVHTATTTTIVVVAVVQTATATTTTTTTNPNFINKIVKRTPQRTQHVHEFDGEIQYIDTHYITHTITLIHCEQRSVHLPLALSPSPAHSPSPHAHLSLRHSVVAQCVSVWPSSVCLCVPRVSEHYVSPPCHWLVDWQRRRRRCRLHGGARCALGFSYARHFVNCVSKRARAGCQPLCVCVRQAHRYVCCATMMTTTAMTRPLCSCIWKQRISLSMQRRKMKKKKKRPNQREAIGRSLLSLAHRIPSTHTHRHTPNSLSSSHHIVVIVCAHSVCWIL